MSLAILKVLTVVADDNNVSPSNIPTCHGVVMQRTSRCRNNPGTAMRRFSTPKIGLTYFLRLDKLWEDVGISSTFARVRSEDVALLVFHQHVHHHLAKLHSPQ